MPSSLRRELICLSILLFAVGSSYLITVKNPFIYDDEYLIVNNDRIKEFNSGTVKAAFTDRFIYNIAAGEIYRPLQFLLLSAEYHLFGPNPLWFHAVNALLHYLSVISLYLLIKKIHDDNNIPLVTALIFSLHPINTEAVAWIKGNDNILCNIFYTASLVAYISWSRYRQSFLNFSYLLSCSLFVLALFSKETAVTLPAVILAFEFIINKNRPNILIKIIPYVVLATAYFYIRTTVLGRVGQESWYFGKGILENVATSLSVVMVYLRLLLFPFNQNADYFNFPVTKEIFSPVIFISATVILYFFILGCRMRQKAPVVTFFIAWFFIAILPIINIIPIKILIAERFMYLPAAGMIGVASYSLLSVRKKRLIYSFVLLIVISFGSLTILRNEVWSSPYAFWSDALKKDSKNARAHANMAMMYLERHDTKSAQSHFLKTLDSLTLASDSFVKLAYRFQEAGDLESAITAFKRASFDPTLLSVHSNLGLIYQSQGRLDEAIYEFKKELELNPNDMLSLINIGFIYGAGKKCNEAEFIFKRALTLNPSDIQALQVYNNVMTTNCVRK